MERETAERIEAEAKRLKLEKAERTEKEKLKLEKAEEVGDEQRKCELEKKKLRVNHNNGDRDHKN